ncbi:HNH endonuclease [Paramicrobacterium sp. CJ85]|uniref:HNH endonuclease n=1 Tax=Paramicrobacterium sp. CJ85 TaxID=3445355 RepID=UPI003F5EC229
MRTLVLNAGFEPLAVVSFRRALALVLCGKAAVVEIVEDDPVWGVSVRYDRPSVIVLTRYVKVPYSRRIPVSRRGVLKRDLHTCGYCGASATTIDHVIPRSRGGEDSWENLVACCLRCNSTKGNRTPAEIGWQLRITPRMPYGPGWAVRGVEGVLPQWQQYLSPSVAA